MWKSVLFRVFNYCICKLEHTGEMVGITGNDELEGMWLWPSLSKILVLFWGPKENHKSLTHYGWCPARCSELHLSTATDKALLFGSAFLLVT
jgi:hypothetical protein